MCLQTLVLLFKVPDRKSKEFFVSAANSSQVGTVIKIGDGTDIFAVDGHLYQELNHAIPSPRNKNKNSMNIRQAFLSTRKCIIRYFKQIKEMRGPR